MENTRVKHPALAFLVSLSVAGTCLAAPGLALAAPSTTQADEPAEATAAEGAADEATAAEGTADATAETTEPDATTDEAAISNPELKGAEEAAATADKADQAQRAKGGDKATVDKAPGKADKAATDTKDIKADSGSITFGGVTVAIPDSFMVMDFPHLMTVAVAPTGDMSVTLASPAMVMVDETSSEVGPELFDEIAASLAEGAGIDTPEAQQITLTDGTEAYEYIFELVDPDSGEPVASNAAVYMVFVPVDDSYTVVQVTVDRSVADVSQDTVDSIISSIAVGTVDKTAQSDAATTDEAATTEEAATDAVQATTPDVADETTADAAKTDDAVTDENKDATEAEDAAKTDATAKTDDTAKADDSTKTDEAGADKTASTDAADKTTDETAKTDDAAASDTTKSTETTEPEATTDEAAISNPELKGAEEAAADADKAAEAEETAKDADQATTTDTDKADAATDETAATDEADATEAAAETDAATAVAGTAESLAGMSFDIPEGLSATDESSDQQGIWTDESGDLVVRVTPNVVDSVQSMTLRDLTREAYGLASSLDGEVVGYATYENDDTTVYTYAIVFERDGVEQMGTVGYVPVADGSLSAISCAFPLSDMETYAPMVESIYESVTVAE